LNTSDKYRHYSAADIQKYLRGDLSAREMQALEAAALEDPFLADALEGMESDSLRRGEGKFGEDMALLKDRLARRLAEKEKGIVMPLYRSVWKVAAAVILLAGLGAITYRYLLNGRPSTPALASAAAEKKTQSADSFSKDRSKPENTDQDKADSAGIAIAPLQQPEASYKAAPSQKQNLVSGDMLIKTRRQEKKADAKSKMVSAGPAAETAEDKTPPPAPAASESRALYAVADSTNRAGYLVGKVTDANNNRIPVITISIAGRQHIVRTDSNGLFRVQMLGSDSATHIRIGSSGFESIDVPADILAYKSTNGGMANTIRLQSQADGVGYAAVNSERFKKVNSDNILNNATSPAAMQKNIVQQAVPASGWTVYKSYLEKNKMDRSIDPGRKGMEAISFKVSKKGHLSSFRVESSLSPAHDSLLIHLIKHGASWKPLNGNKSGATVILSY
jgi:cytoskeletal protein RodZ